MRKIISLSEFLSIVDRNTNKQITIESTCSNFGGCMTYTFCEILITDTLVHIVSWNKNQDDLYGEFSFNLDQIKEIGIHVSTDGKLDERFVIVIFTNGSKLNFIFSI